MQSKRSMMLWVFLGIALVLGAFFISTYVTVNTVVDKVSGIGGGMGRGHDDIFEDSGNLAVVDVKGIILDGDSFLRAMEELKDMSSVKAVVIRINSPGGAVAPSQEMYNAILRLRETKTVYCSLGDVAASGGYYIAAACEKIVSNPGTLTGSIGVIMHFMNLKDLYAWAKVTPVTMKAGKYKDIGSESRPMTEDEKILLQDMLNGVHKQFKEAVASGRSMKSDVVDTYADGRILNGDQALKLGFVDELGGEYETIQAAAKKAGIVGEPKVIRESKHKKRFLSFFENRSQDLTKEGLLQDIAGEVLPSLKLTPGTPYFLPAHMFK